MPQGPKDYLALGDWNAFCDGCHFKFKASELRKDWQGYMKCGPCFETRHPMDFQKPPRPSQPVPWTRSNDDAGPRQDVAGNDIVTGAVGAKYKHSAYSEIGLAWEVPLTDRRDIIDNRLTVDWIIRY